jgi:hypothetical protein
MVHFNEATTTLGRKHGTRSFEWKYIASVRRPANEMSIRDGDGDYPDL